MHTWSFSQARPLTRRRITKNAPHNVPQYHPTIYQRTHTHLRHRPNTFVHCVGSCTTPASSPSRYHKLIFPGSEWSRAVRCRFAIPFGQVAGHAVPVPHGACLFQSRTCSCAAKARGVPLAQRGNGIFVLPQWRKLWLSTKTWLGTVEEGETDWRASSRRSARSKNDGLCNPSRVWRILQEARQRRTGQVLHAAERGRPSIAQACMLALVAGGVKLAPRTRSEVAWSSVCAAANARRLRHAYKSGGQHYVPIRQWHRGFAASHCKTVGCLLLEKCVGALLACSVGHGPVDGQMLRACGA